MTIYHFHWWYPNKGMARITRHSSWLPHDTETWIQNQSFQMYFVTVQSVTMVHNRNLSGPILMKQTMTLNTNNIVHSNALKLTHLNTHPHLKTINNDTFRGPHRGVSKMKIMPHYYVAPRDQCVLDKHRNRDNHIQIAQSELFTGAGTLY